jgi:hypothetical protein
VLFLRIYLLLQSIACGFLVELCVEQSQRNIGDRKGACDEKEPPHPAKKQNGLALRPPAALLRVSWSSAFAALSAMFRGTEYPARVRTDKRPRPGALALTSMARYLPSCDAIAEHRSACTDFGYRERSPRKLR